MPAAVETQRETGRQAALTLFALLWAAAALFHNFGGSGRVFTLVDGATPANLSQTILSGCALWLIARPRSLAALGSVAVLGPVTAWFEAPLLGNHWLLTAFVDVGILIAMLLARRSGTFDREAFAAAALPTARWCLIVFYCFAAFAKLNPAFFNTTVSCSTFFFDETAASYGLSTPVAVGGEGLWRLVPIGAALTELSVIALLIGRRTRVFGVVLGLMFHSLIALDRYHLFADFSSVLAALFLLFLPGQFAQHSLRYLEGRGRLWLRLLFIVALAVAVLEVVVNLDPQLVPIFLQGRILVWYLFDAVVLAGTLGWLWRHRGTEPLEHPFALPGWGSGRFVLIGLLVVLVANGLLAYLELRTAFDYTMYSNLKMVDGYSNHFIARSSLPLGDRHEDLVRVDASSDPGLRLYVGTPYLLPWDSFRAYLSTHPEVAVSYTRDGRHYVLSRAANDPELVDAPPWHVQKTLPLRAVDIRNPPPCQDVFLPAL